MRYLPKGQQRGRRVQLAAGVSHISLRYNYCGISRNTSIALENCVVRSQQLLQWNCYIYEKLAYLVIIVKIVYSAFSTNIFFTNVITYKLQHSTWDSRWAHLLTSHWRRYQAAISLEDEVAPTTHPGDLAF